MCAVRNLWIHMHAHVYFTYIFVCKGFFKLRKYYEMTWVKKVVIFWSRMQNVSVPKKLFGRVLIQFSCNKGLKCQNSGHKQNFLHLLCWTVFMVTKCFLIWNPNLSCCKLSWWLLILLCIEDDWTDSFTKDLKILCHFSEPLLSGIQFLIPWISPDAVLQAGDTSLDGKYSISSNPAIWYAGGTTLLQGVLFFWH